MTRLQKLTAEPTHARTFALIALSSLLMLGLSLKAIPWWHCLLLLPVGAFSWTFAEYLLHRFIFHLSMQHPLRFLGATLHAQHHAAPNQPPITKPPALTLSAFAVTSTFAFFVAGGYALPVFTGMLFGYLCYEVSHVASHALSPEEHPLANFQASHLQHHQTPSARFGITSPLWDHIFRSL